MTNQDKEMERKDYRWVAERRAGNMRIVLYIVGFCLVVMMFSGWSFIRFMERRTGYERDIIQTQNSG